MIEFAVSGIKHGYARRGRRPSEYNIWRNLRQRCLNPRGAGFKHYGGRGIRVCAEWNNFSRFLADMGPRPSQLHSIERINNDGNYEPSNCRWATKIEQMNNRSINRLIAHDGQTMTLAQWARKTGLSGVVIAARIDRLGWSVERALCQELRGR
jgi:hypothetical protein